MLQLRGFRLSWAASMRCVLLPGGVFRGTAISDFEAESVGDVNLSTDKRGDMLCLPAVLHTSCWAHLIEHLKGGWELLMQVCWLFICWKYFSCSSRSPYNSQVCIAVMSVRSATFGNLACLRSASSVSTLLILVYNTPMTVNILSIPILVNRIWMSGHIHIPSVLMDGYLIDAFFFCWAWHCLLLLNY